MRPVPVPEYVRNSPWVEGTAVFAAPDGDLTSTKIPPAEGLFYTSRMAGFDDQEIPMVAVVVQLDDSEVEAIRDGARHIMLSWPGRQMPVFIVPDVLVEQKSESP